MTATTVTTSEPNVQVSITYPFCPSWCLGHDDDEAYTIDEQGIDANRAEFGMPDDLALGDVVFTHTGNNDIGAGLVSMSLQQFHTVRGGNLVTGGGVLRRGPVLVMIWAPGIDGCVAIEAEDARVVADGIGLLVDRLSDDDDQR